MDKLYRVNICLTGTYSWIGRSMSLYEESALWEMWTYNHDPIYPFSEVYYNPIMKLYEIAY